MVNIKELFDYTKTDEVSYTKILANKVVSKPLTKGTMNAVRSHRPVGRIINLSPKVAIKESFPNPSTPKLSHKFKPEDFKIKLPLPIIDIMSKVGYGIQVMLLCESWKLQEMPVFVVGRTDEDIDKWVSEVKPKVSKPKKEVKSGK